jgi:hypothetical protein
VIAMPDAFVQLGEPWNERHPVPASAATFELPAIEVVRGTPIRGRLVDMGKRPLANRRISGGTPGRRYAFATTGADGEFTTNSVPADIELNYSVWVNDRQPPVDAAVVQKRPLLLQAPVGAPP